MGNPLISKSLVILAKTILPKFAKLRVGRCRLYDGVPSSPVRGMRLPKKIGRGMPALSPTDKSVRGGLPRAPLGLETGFRAVLALSQVEGQATGRPFLCVEELLLHRNGSPLKASHVLLGHSELETARTLAEHPVSPTRSLPPTP